MYQFITRLRILPVAYLFWVSILPVLGWNQIVNAGPDLSAGDELDVQAPSSSNHIFIVTETVAAGSDIVMTASQDARVTVTVTTIETAMIESDTASLDGLDSSSTRGSANDQPETAAITYTPEAGTGTGASNVDLVGTASTDETSRGVNTKTSLHHPSSIFSPPHGTGGNSAVTTLATITPVTSSSLSTSTFDDASCDVIFCNTDGNRICIYWAGVTSWDVSRGPIPGERPTVIGAC
ncbi:hypothetical protein F4823DRAFT_560835 [Ustulina deusta]|nr:hypothetical protein F4823DRAFT_560835 [Ustulina deusta]